jgi:hypothetical protein
MRAAKLLLGLLAAGLLVAPSLAVEGLSNKDIETVMVQFITDLSKSLAQASPKRRLLSSGSEASGSGPRAACAECSAASAEF